MKLDNDSIELQKVNENIYQLLCEKKKLQFWTPDLRMPFGVDSEYGKYVARLELLKPDERQETYFIKIIRKIEGIIKRKLDLQDIEFKSSIRVREKYNTQIETQLKKVKNSFITEVEYEDTDTHYLKTVLEIPKNSVVSGLMEIYGIWDYREEGNVMKNKVGLIIYVNKIVVKK